MLFLDSLARPSGPKSRARSPAARSTMEMGLMALAINDTAPDFEKESTEGRIRFHDWIGNGWAVLFSHPKDFTPVCTTELGYMAKIKPEFEKRNVKIIGLSVDPVGDHTKWSNDQGDARTRAQLSHHRGRRLQGIEACWNWGSRKATRS